MKLFVKMETFAINRFFFFSRADLRIQDKPLQELRMILGFTVFNSNYL